MKLSAQQKACGRVNRKIGIQSIQMQFHPFNASMKKKQPAFSQQPFATAELNCKAGRLQAPLAFAKVPYLEVADRG